MKRCLLTLNPFFDQAFAGDRVTYERELISCEGSSCWIQVNLVPEVSATGKVISIYALASDITARRDIEDALQKSQAGFKSIVQMSPIGIQVYGLNGVGLFCNATAQRMMSDIVQPDCMLIELTDLVEGDRREQNITRPDGSDGVAELHVVKTVWGGEAAMLVMMHDITDRKKNDRRIHHMAYHDSLTGLPNRALVHDRIEHAIEKAHRKGSLVGLLYLDLDRFKVINDSLGHAAGDELLKITAQRLRRCVRKGDTVARLSGDEFLIVIEDVGYPRDVEKVASDIVRAFEDAVRIKNTELVVNISIGISVYPEDGVTSDILIMHADKAMYHAKKTCVNKCNAIRGPHGGSLG